MECIVDEEQLRLYVFSLSLSLLLSLFLRCASSAKLKNRYAKAVGGVGGNGATCMKRNAHRAGRQAGRLIQAAPSTPVLLSFREFKCHTRIERYAWPVCYSCPTRPPPVCNLLLSTSSSPFYSLAPSQVDCETSPGRAKANTAAACFFGLCLCICLCPPTPACIEQMPKNVTVPRTIITVNCGRGWWAAQTIQQRSIF